MITDAAIKKALREAPTSGKKSIELSDDGPRGGGRLKLVIRVTEKRVIAEWYAAWWSDGKSARAKIGAYPTLGLRDARQDFAVRCRPCIVKGMRPGGLLPTRTRQEHPSDRLGLKGDIMEPRPLRNAETRARAHALAISIVRIERRDLTLGPYDVLMNDVRRAEAIIDDLERGDFQIVRVGPNPRASGMEQ